MSDVAGVIEQLRYRVNNPSAWADFDQGASDLCSQSADLLSSLSARIAELERERDEALQAEDLAKDAFWAIYPYWVERNGRLLVEAAKTMLVKRAEAAEAKLAKAVEALKWYGEQSRLCRLVHSGGDTGRHALADDGGKRARDVLAALSPMPNKEG